MGLRSAQLVTLSVAAYRNSRRSDRNLDITARTIDTAVDSAFAADAFITGVLAELDTDLGLLTVRPQRRTRYRRAVSDVRRHRHRSARAR